MSSRAASGRCWPPSDAMRGSVSAPRGCCRIGADGAAQAARRGRRILFAILSTPPSRTQAFPRPRGVARRVPAGRSADPRAARAGPEHDRLRRRQRRPDRRPQPRAAERDAARPQRRRRPRLDGRDGLRHGLPQPRHGRERAHGLPHLGRLHGLRAARRQLRRERRRPDDGHWRLDVLEQRRRLAADRQRDELLATFRGNGHTISPTSTSTGPRARGWDCSASWVRPPASRAWGLCTPTSRGGRTPASSQARV